MQQKKKKNTKSKKNTAQKKEVAAQSIKKDKALLIVALGLILLFGAVIVGVKLINKPQETMPEIKVFKGITFQKVGDIWQTKITVGNRNTQQTKDYDILFHFTPDEVENITTTVTANNESVSSLLLAMADKVYITFDANETGTSNSMILLGGFEIAKILASIYGKEVKSAVTQEINITGSTVITCANASRATSVVYIKSSDRTGIFVENGCILVEAEDPEDLVKVSERLSFELLKLL